MVSASANGNEFLKNPDRDTQLPKYAPPTIGTLSLLPSSWVPYGELMRLDKPGGIYAFIAPLILGTLFAACLADPVPQPQRVAELLMKSVLLAIISRGAACVWNDNIDQEYDRKVTRCRLRPIARGAVSTGAAHLFAFALSAMSIMILAWFPGNCIYHAGIILPLWMFYPFAKRLTDYPQFVLGITFACYNFLCCSAFGVDPFTTRHLVPTAAMFANQVVWTMVYDTIYAHQDLQDDVKAGVKSMAVRFANSTKLLAAVLGATQVLLLAMVGVAAEFNLLYFVGTCVTTAVTSIRMLCKVDLKDPASCAWYFRHGFIEIGGSMALGFWLQYLVKLGLLEQ